MQLPSCCSRSFPRTNRYFACLRSFKSEARATVRELLTPSQICLEIERTDVDF